MDFNPIILDGKIAMVHRADLLFCYCGQCKRRLCWRPIGGMKFGANCGVLSYTAEPTTINNEFFQVVRSEVPTENVSVFEKRIKPTLKP